MIRKSDIGIGRGQQDMFFCPLMFLPKPMQNQVTVSVTDGTLPFPNSNRQLVIILHNK